MATPTKKGHEENMNEENVQVSSFFFYSYTLFFFLNITADIKKKKNRYILTNLVMIRIAK